MIVKHNISQLSGDHLGLYTSKNWTQAYSHERRNRSKMNFDRSSHANPMLIGKKIIIIKLRKIERNIDFIGT